MYSSYSTSYYKVSVEKRGRTQAYEVGPTPYCFCFRVLLHIVSISKIDGLVPIQEISHGKEF